MYTCKLIDLGEGPSSQGQSLHESNVTNWKLCVICQRDTTEKLVHPDNARYRGLKECGYKLFADNILEFNKINCLSEDISIRRLDNGEGVEATLQSNKAVWHKSCRNRYDNQKLQRAQKRKAKEQTEFEPSPIKTRHSGPGSMARTNNCFFCDEDDTREQLHNAQTDKLDRRIREYAHILQDRKLLGKLSEGDMHALDARYHLSCMTSLSNCVRKHNAEPKKDGLKNKADSLVLAELVSYIEECRSDETLPVFKLSNLRKLYESRLKEKDPSFSGKVNTTRLKERLMSLVPDLKAQTQGREVMMMFSSDIGEAIKIACANNDDDDAIHLARAAQILRKDIFAKEYTFDGSFKPESERDAVPESVLALVSMILRGPSIQHQKQAPDPSTKIALSLSQLVVFNAKKTSKESKESSGSHTRHIKARETPLVIYTGLMIHAKTRQRGLLDKLSSRGLSISYERTKEISTNLGNAVCAQFDRDGCVCPTTLKSDVFTVGAVDNIDHNPSARNAMDSFHGTAISMLQFPTPDKPGTDRDSIHIKPDMTNNRTKSVLPAEYTEIAPAALPGNQLLAPVSTGPVKAESTAMTASRDTEDGWLRAMSEIVQKKEELDPKDFVSWAAYHANRQSAEIRPLSRTALLPLFTEQAHNPATIVHAMKLVAKAIDHLHPGQKPVITMDQPLFCIAKQIQWTWPDAFGEDRFVVMMGGLHIEMNVLKLIGDFLSGSGWTTILVQSEVTTAGRADAILKGSHVTRSRYVHQVTAATLYLLQVSAYEKYQESLSPDDENMDFTSWCNARTKQSPQFQYWTTVLELELLVMQFVRSLREADFTLYVQCLGQLVPWMFSLDHTNYARWLPIHIKDMVQLKHQAPSVHAEFEKGHFVVKKTDHVFSTMAMDQAHEQLNDHIKGDGGIIGITDNSSALIQWITAGPEIARIIDEFENSFGMNRTKSTQHHDQTPSVQSKFAQHVKAMVTTFQELGNPFTEDSRDLVRLDTKEVMGQSAVTSVQRVKEIGQSQYDVYVAERLEDQTTPVSDIISKNNLTLFRKISPSRPSKTSHQIRTLKSNCELFGRMYISCQSRNGDMDEFFRHENQGSPPSLSDMGELRQCKKSDLIGCFDKLISASNSDSPQSPAVDAKLLDGSVIVNMLLPKSCAIFGDYAEQVFIPYILRNLQTCKRLDVVWDRYINNSLKSSARQKRGSGNRVIVKNSTPIPKNWNSFLRVDENKSELYQYLSQCILKLSPEGKELYSTEDKNVVSSQGCDAGVAMAPSDHEEADTRLILHALHCAQCGHKRVMIRSVDTDVVVLAIANFHALGLDELWVAFGVKKHYRVIPVHDIATNLGEEMARALPFFHAVSGCDTTSSFSGIGKKTAWDTWAAFPAITGTFVSLSEMPAGITDENLRHLERFVILLFDRTSDCVHVDTARKHLFAKGRQLDRIPPTKAALIEHVKRAAYQAGHVWGQSCVAQQNLPNPSDWGWTKEASDRWVPFWSALPEAAKSCKELIKCGCKKACRLPCKCLSASLTCTELCHCAGTCFTFTSDIDDPNSNDDDILDY